MSMLGKNEREVVVVTPPGLPNLMSRSEQRVLLQNNPGVTIRKATDAEHAEFMSRLMSRFETSLTPDVSYRNGLPK